MGIKMSDASICAMCKEPITDTYLLRVGLVEVHETCLKCFSCGTSLTQTCVLRGGNFYCKRDFYSIYGPRCVGCQLQVGWREKVRKIGESFFHGTCFKCSDCAKDLSGAERIGCDLNGNVLCESDFMKQRSSTEPLPEPEEETAEPVTEAVKEPGVVEEDSDDPKAKRKRGPKTTIQPNQLTVLRTCFDKNPKPSPKIFEELSKDTGLTKRVIQVWFQNRRSKKKRINSMQTLMQVGFAPEPGPYSWDGSLHSSCYPFQPHHGNFNASFTAYHDKVHMFESLASDERYANSERSFANSERSFGNSERSFANSERSFASSDCYPSPPILPTDFPISEFPDRLPEGVFASPDS